VKASFKGQISPDLKVWSKEQCYDLHLKSLEILERTGSIFYDETALKILKQGGAYVRGNRVYIPPYMVEEAIRTAPGRIALKGRDDKILRLEGKNVYYGLGTDLPFFLDIDTREYRKTVLKDIENVATLVDWLPHFDFVASLGIASDVTTQLADLYHFKTMHEYCQKPILMTATDEDNLQGLIDMAAVSVGSYDELKRNPLFLLYAEPISPLIHSKEVLRKLMLASKYEIPITYASGISSGTTGPVTLAGTLALANAECLAGLVLHQLVNPGAPFMYGIVASPCDMNTTMVNYGGPEMPLNYCIVGEMGEFYNLPTYGQSGCTDSPVLDQQAGIEAMFSIFGAALSGTNLVHDNGYIGNGLIGSLEMLVLCDECISMVDYFMKGIEVNQETLALETIHQTGPGGHFLATDHTLKHFRSSSWNPRYLNRRDYQNWESSGKITMEEKIREEVKEILATHKPESLPENIKEELDRIIKEHEKRIAAKR
jgi:trimethylamine--corrinoid protein Co-methyltransferase